MASKVENDAAALIRSIAQERGRNADMLEATVREAASYSAQEAVAGNVADFIAEDMDDLLAQLHGRTAETSRGPVVLDTRSVDRRAVEKNVLEHFLEFISDPNVSFLLLSIGGLGIVIELFNPGLIVPAVVGVICLLLAFLAIGNLPVNWGGVVFILLAVALAGFEVAVSGFGVLGIGAIVCLVVGGFLLFAQFGDASPTLPPIEVNPWLVGGSGAVLTAVLAYTLFNAVQSRREGRSDPASELIGTTGVVTGRLDPLGVVRVSNETWTAVSEGGRVIEVGEPVQVTGVEGLVVTVSRHNPPGSSDAGNGR
jgi:membrane-bound serine protease (ClpP class)